MKVLVFTDEAWALASRHLAAVGAMVPTNTYVARELARASNQFAIAELHQFVVLERCGSCDCVLGHDWSCDRLQVLPCPQCQKAYAATPCSVYLGRTTEGENNGLAIKIGCKGCGAVYAQPVGLHLPKE